MRTSSIIARKLKELGYEVLIGEDVCMKDERMGVPSEEVLKAAYERAFSQGAPLGVDEVETVGNSL